MQGCVVPPYILIVIVACALLHLLQIAQAHTGLSQVVQLDRAWLPEHGSRRCRPVVDLTSAESEKVMIRDFNGIAAVGPAVEPGRIFRISLVKEENCA